MTNRSGVAQVLFALAISAIAVGVILGISSYAYRADKILGHGPLASSVSSSEGYLITLVVAGLAILSAGVTYVGLVRTKSLTGRFSWLPQVIIAVTLLLLVLVPLQRFGSSSWGGVPTFLVSMPSRMVVALTLGFLFFHAIERLLRPASLRDQGGLGATTSVGGSATAIRGLPGRFTPGAWRVLAAMQEEAKRFEHGFMGTEHLVLGMLRERQGLASKVMVNLGVDVESARSQIEGIVGKRGSLYTGSVGLTRRCKRIIEQAARRARESGRRTVGTGHLLLSLMTDPEDAAGQLLESMGVTERRVEEEIRRFGYESEETETRAS